MNSTMHRRVTQTTDHAAESFLIWILLILRHETFHRINTQVQAVTIFSLVLLITAQDFLSIEPHSKNGMENGLRLLVDAETFEYSYFPRGSEGFDVALSDSRDRAVVRQQGEGEGSKPY